MEWPQHRKCGQRGENEEMDKLCELLGIRLASPPSSEAAAVRRPDVPPGPGAAAVRHCGGDHDHQDLAPHGHRRGTGAGRRPGDPGPGGSGMPGCPRPRESWCPLPRGLGCPGGLYPGGGGRLRRKAPSRATRNTSLCCRPGAIPRCWCWERTALGGQSAGGAPSGAVMPGWPVYRRTGR